MNPEAVMACAVVALVIGLGFASFNAHRAEKTRRADLSPAERERLEEQDRERTQGY